MAEYLPISKQNVRLKALKEIFQVDISDQQFARLSMGGAAAPQNLSDLPYQDTFTATLSIDVAASLGIPFGAADFKFARKVFIQEYLKYIDVQDGGIKVRWGVGVRWIVNFRSIDAQAKTAS